MKLKLFELAMLPRYVLCLARVSAFCWDAIDYTFQKYCIINNFQQSLSSLREQLAVVMLVPTEEPLHRCVWGRSREVVLWKLPVALFHSSLRSAVVSRGTGSPKSSRTVTKSEFCSWRVCLSSLMWKVCFIRLRLIVMKTPIISLWLQLLNENGATMKQHLVFQVERSWTFIPL